MKYSKEFKIGVFVVVVLTASFFVINYLRGKDIFNKEIEIVSEYPNLEGLVESAPVFIKGFKAGKVSEVAYDSETELFKVTCSVKKEFRHQTRPISRDGKCKELKCDGKAMKDCKKDCTEMKDCKKNCDKKNDCPKMKGECKDCKSCDKAEKCDKAQACHKNGKCDKAEKCDQAQKCDKKAECTKK